MDLKAAAEASSFLRAGGEIGFASLSPLFAAMTCVGSNRSSPQATMVATKAMGCRPLMMSFHYGERSGAMLP